MKAHLFICTAAPDKEGKCGHKGSEELRLALKERCSKEEWAKDVRINSSGCLGHCKLGITTVMYPQSEWNFEIKKDQIDLLFESVKSHVETNK